MSDEENPHFGDAPEELSAKKPVSFYRVVVPNKKSKGRDPRFDSKCGDFNTNLYEKSYGFIEDIKKKEIKTIGDQLKKQKLDEEEKHQLVKAKNILQDQLRTEEKKRTLEEFRKNTRKQEASLVEKGKKPYYLKKSEEKKVLLEEQYETLKKQGKLKKWLAQKARRKAAKEHKLMPRTRRSIGKNIRSEN